MKSRDQEIFFSKGIDLQRGGLSRPPIVTNCQGVTQLVLMTRGKASQAKGELSKQCLPSSAQLPGMSQNSSPMAPCEPMKWQAGLGKLLFNLCSANKNNKFNVGWPKCYEDRAQPLKLSRCLAKPFWPLEVSLTCECLLSCSRTGL